MRDFFADINWDRWSETLWTHGLRVLSTRSTNCGDAGLALGQAWVAAHHLAISPEAAACA